MKDPKTSASRQSAGTEQAAETNEAAAQVLEDLEALRSRLQAAEQSRDLYLDLAQRTKADFENYQKRMQRDLAQERRYAQTPLAADLLGPLDNLERAIAAAKTAGDKSGLAQGVIMVHAQFLDALRRHGITPIEAQGKPFDPNSHEAVLQEPSSQPAMTVVRVLEQGYMIHDRVLRPARVAVSVAPSANQEQKSGGPWQGG